MIPPRELAPGDEWLDQALAEIRGVELTDYGTMAHLGVTWARRMLHPAWDAIWDPNGDPDDAVDGSQLQKDPDVTQVLVLLSDGGNSMQAVDPWDRVPGRASVHLGIDIGPGGTEVKKLKMRRSFTSGVTLGSLTLERNTVVGYGALGRNGPGTAADGHRSDVRHITSQESGQAEHAIPDLARKGRRFLDEILTASCGEARNEGIEIYTVSLSSAHGDARHQDQILQACAGTQLAPGDSGYAFRAQDEDGIRAAFRDIGQRVVRIRRAS